MFLPCERANRRNFHHVCTVPVVTGGPLCAGNHTHPQLINNSQINFLRCICLFSSPSLSMYSIYSKTLSFSSPFLVHFYISSIVFCYLFPAIHQLYCILILPFTDAALGLLWFPYMNPFLCLPLCRMISTEPSSGLTQPCLTRWWYSSARWSVSCLHGGYPHCWHWTERGGERKEGKERYYMEVEEEMKGVTADRVRKGAKGGWDGQEMQSNSAICAEKERQNKKYYSWSYERER